MASNIPSPTTEADAINIMLGGIGESPLTDIDDEMSVDAVNAKNDLLFMSRAIQKDGYSFNTEYGYPLPPNAEGMINLPINCVKADVDPLEYPHIDPVVRGNRLYDRKNHTYKFDGTIKAEITLILPFEELPEHARWYITVAATRWFQERWFGSGELAGFTRSDEQTAKTSFIQTEEAQEDHNVLWGRGTPFATFIPGQVIRRR